MKRLIQRSLENPSRRQFLQVATIAGGGFAIGFGSVARAVAGSSSVAFIIHAGGRTPDC